MLRPFDYSTHLFLCLCMLCCHAAIPPSSETVEAAFQEQIKRKQKEESASTVIITIDCYDFSDSSWCFFFFFRNVTISLMRLVMSMVIISDATTVSVTARHGLHHVLLLFFPLSFFPVTVCIRLNKACNVPPCMPGVPVSEHEGQRVFVCRCRCMLA